VTGQNAITLVLNAGVPFIRETGPLFTFQEAPFFETLDETFIPLLGLFDRLEAAHIPFRVAIVVPPVLCHLLTDPNLIERYIRYMDNRIAFGVEEIERLGGNPRLRALAGEYYDTEVDKRFLFTERYQKNILKVLFYHKQRGRIEFINSAATNVFFPFYTASPSVFRAQFEIALRSGRRFFNSVEAGFWLPELGYCAELGNALHTHHYAWTIIDTHAALLATPPPERGSFYPARDPSGVTLFIRDFSAYEEIMNTRGNCPQSGAFRSYFDDAGYELPAEKVKRFLSSNGARTATGYKYYARGEGLGTKEVYEREAGVQAAREMAAAFLKARTDSLAAARAAFGKMPVSVCAYHADYFGRFWHEGCVFLEALFREAARRDDVRFVTPSEYLSRQDAGEFQTLHPVFTSEGHNGYAEDYLDASNDWVYRHILRASERMSELAGRFHEESDDLRERALNQAARELLLAQDVEWVRIISTGEQRLSGEWPQYARERIETHLRNFTTFYEALGSDYISTRFLTDLEQRDNIFPDMNYRVFTSR
jgi:1,4-alpha-glucan branching enzyme